MTASSREIDPTPTSLSGRIDPITATFSNGIDASVPGEIGERAQTASRGRIADAVERVLAPSLPRVAPARPMGNTNEGTAPTLSVAPPAASKGAPIQRAFDTRTSAATIDQATNGLPAGVGTANEEPDLDQLADEVYARLRWRLVVERERLMG